MKLYLYHYYDKTYRPFLNLSDLSFEDANKVMDHIRKTKPKTLAAKRHPDYMKNRLYYEEILRTEFMKKGGNIKRKAPHYMVIEHSPWLSTCFDNCGYVKIPIEEFDLSTISFTYGDSHPTFSSKINDGKEYRKKLYTYDEICKVIETYGLPQNWNDDGKYGPERYIEAHIWSDETIDKYR